MLRAQYTLLSEFCRLGQRGTVDFIGSFDRLLVGGFPAQHQTLALVILLVAESEDSLGKREIRLEFRSPSGALLVEQNGAVVVKPEGGTWLGSARLIFEMRGMVFPEPGRYWFRLFVENTELAAQPLTVVRQSPEK